MSVIEDATNLARKKSVADSEYYAAERLSESNKVCKLVTYVDSREFLSLQYKHYIE